MCVCVCVLRTYIEIEMHIHEKNIYIEGFLNEKLPFTCARLNSAAISVKQIAKTHLKSRFALYQSGWAGWVSIKIIGSKNFL